MYQFEELFIILISLHALLYIFSKIADNFHTYFQNSRRQFRAYYRVTIAIMIVIICLTASIVSIKNMYAKLSFRPDNKHELYRMEKINYNIHIQDDGSANVEHIIVLLRNEHPSAKSDDKKLKTDTGIINYEFNEVSGINDIQVFVNGKKLEKDLSNMNSTFSTKFTKNKKKIDIYLPYLNEKLEIRISYLVKNALLKDENGKLTYYNSFLAYRSGLSYNTQFKGNIRFFMPRNFVPDIAAYCDDMYVLSKKEGNVASIYFENKPKRNFFFSGRIINHVKEYDDVDAWKNYNRNFSVITRLDVDTGGDLSAKNLPHLDKNAYLISDLQKSTDENNKNYSYANFLYICIFNFIIGGIILLMVPMFPFVRWYYRKKLNEYWKFMLDSD
ncbi:hypothetical protein HMPREF1142_0059 [Peptostreptococcaceae bacterium AS15]|nr:hypothetical protein HMPREF1142_0059 [Peptostreptococcaceae bacterium AS15]